MRVDDKVTFEEEPDLPYTVQAVSEWFVVLTRPMAEIDREVFRWEGDDCPVYTIIDKDANMRGPHNMVFNAYDFDDRADCERCLADMEDSDNWLELSTRRYLPVELV